MDCDGVGAHADGAGVRTRVRLRRAEASVPGLEYKIIQGPIQNIRTQNFYAGPHIKWCKWHGRRRRGSTRWRRRREDAGALALAQGGKSYTGPYTKWCKRHWRLWRDIDGYGVTLTVGRGRGCACAGRRRACRAWARPSWPASTPARRRSSPTSWSKNNIK